jgi:hypothetical protein
MLGQFFRRPQPFIGEKPIAAPGVRFEKVTPRLRSLGARFRYLRRASRIERQTDRMEDQRQRREKLVVLAEMLRDQRMLSASILS